MQTLRNRVVIHLRDIQAACRPPAIVRQLPVGLKYIASVATKTRPTTNHHDHQAALNQPNQSKLSAPRANHGAERPHKLAIMPRGKSSAG